MASGPEGSVDEERSVHGSTDAAARRAAPPDARIPAPARPSPHPAAAPSATETRQPATRRRRLGGGAALWALLAAALALYWAPLLDLDAAGLDGMGGLGLVSVLPVPTLVGGGLLVCAFVAGLRSSTPRPVLLAAVLLLTVVSLHAVPAVVESEPRFATAWQHLGFLDRIERTGSTAPDLDARWSWPGFFAAVAFVAQACGVDDFTETIRWWPTLVQLAYLAPLALLLRAVRADRRAKWCALWFFALCGWVGQDYFSPQGFTLLFHLLFVAVLLLWFARTSAPRRGRAPGETPPAGAPGSRVRAVGPTELAVLLGLLLALFVAATAGHQLTPFVMLGVLLGLVLVRRTVPRGLPLVCGIVLVCWIVYLAEPYWSGHFDELFGGIGGLGGNVSSSVTGRIEGGAQVHRLVLYARVALAAGVLALAALGAWRRRRAGVSDRSLLVLTAVPFLAFGAQSYGGEIALRVFLFAAPGACVLAALALYPRLPEDGGPQPAAARPRRTPSRAAPVAALLAGLVLLSGFLVVRWGNEPFERVRAGEVEAMEYVYAHDRPTVRLLWPSSDPVEEVTPSIPWGARDMERVVYEPVRAPLDPAAAGGLADALSEAGPGSLLMLNEGQSQALRLGHGYPHDWWRKARTALDGDPAVERVHTNRDAVVYRATAPAAGQAPAPEPGPAGIRVTWDTWSLAGALAAGVLLVLLTARELVRVVAPHRLAWLQGTLWFSLPLAALLLGATVLRLWTLS